jgi:hypothetical protein
MMAHSPSADIRQKLQESRQKTLQLLRQFDPETIAYRPRPDAWSVKDHVAHLVAVEESIIHFAHRILNEDCPISPLCHDIAFNQDAWNNREVAERAGYTWIEALCALEATHDELLALLDHIPKEAMNRLGAHPIWGEPVTLASVLRVPYRHERGHRDEIAALYTLLSAQNKPLPQKSR